MYKCANVTECNCNLNTVIVPFVDRRLLDVPILFRNDEEQALLEAREKEVKLRAVQRGRSRLVGEQRKLPSWK